MDPLRVKWWGPKHLGPSYICELSLHPKFRSPSITPSHKKAGAAERKNREQRKKKNNDFNGHLVPTDYVCGDKVFPSDYVGGKASNARAKNRTIGFDIKVINLVLYHLAKFRTASRNLVRQCQELPVYDFLI